ncbi:UTP--glucose-1-phosphate uridylyltransferase [Suicoccus acidiformans]|uniref:UTP--glucose-1-phosphate uridylyltransferase n=1 Tax=Suicoccus acidiformans TaxID=2036206 RepID=A0A347WJV7_9LACT|nr:UTP--glucose-1-phosphate uridylyltransferase [Suicoccus acidiformans]AXY25364.1 UTP--glucose-1-phosphate uridylyltransferase [Suicoccus acidiformans]
MPKIRKAVIPAAGYGLNFLPATKAQPKELLPIVDKPIIQYVIEEAKASGIDEILIITGKNKRPIEDHFDANPELEENLESKGKQALLNIVKTTTYENIFYVRQSEPKGLADAILHAEAFVGNEPFLVLLADNIMEGDVPATKQIIDVFEQIQEPVLAVDQVQGDDLSRYGIVDLATDFSQDGLAKLHTIVEKPSEAQAPSQWAASGRYVLTPDIFDIIRDLQPGVAGEYQLSDAISSLGQEHDIYCYQLQGKRNDAGHALGFVKTSIRHGLEHPETKDELKDYLIAKSKELKTQKEAQYEG